LSGFIPNAVRAGKYFDDLAGKARFVFFAAHREFSDYFDRSSIGLLTHARRGTRKLAAATSEKTIGTGRRGWS
jgi:hypothetical protein